MSTATPIDSTENEAWVYQLSTEDFYEFKECVPTLERLGVVVTGTQISLIVQWHHPHGHLDTKKFKLK